jgi:hypothetical protein
LPLRKRFVNPQTRLRGLTGGRTATSCAQRRTVGWSPGSSGIRWRAPRAKQRANDRRREESPGYNQPRLSQVDAVSSDSERRPQTVRTRLTSEGSPTARAASSYVCRSVTRRSRSLQLVLAQLAGGEQVPDRIFNTPAAAGPRKSLLSIRPFAPSNNFAPALTSAFTRVEDDLVFAGTQGGLRACRPMYL